VPVEPWGGCENVDVARIIMIDDDVEFIELVDDALKARGCIVSFAENGEDGIRLARHLQPELVLLDIVMPGVDGYEVVRRITNEPELRHTRIVAITSLIIDGGEEQRLRAAGFDGYVEKAVDLDALVSRIERFLDSPLAPLRAEG
jgi:CheY-like chemotaxis protein